MALSMAFSSEMLDCGRCNFGAVPAIFTSLYFAETLAPCLFGGMCPTRRRGYQVQEIGSEIGNEIWSVQESQENVTQILSHHFTISIDFHLPYATICHEACLVQDSSGWPSPGLRHLGALGFVVRWMRNKKSAEVPLVFWEYPADVSVSNKFGIWHWFVLICHVIIPHELRCTVMVMVDQCWSVSRQSSERPTSSALFRWM